MNKGTVVVLGDASIKSQLIYMLMKNLNKTKIRRGKKNWPYLHLHRNSCATMVHSKDLIPYKYVIMP